MKKANLYVGGLAYIDTLFNGLIPCKVVEIDGKGEYPTSNIKVKVKVLKTVGAYIEGDIHKGDSLSIVPRVSVYTKGHSLCIRDYSVNL